MFSNYRQDSAADLAKRTPADLLFACVIWLTHNHAPAVDHA